MGFGTSSLQNIIDISTIVDKALKELELPEGYKIENVQFSLTWKKNYIAQIYTYPQIKESEPHINTNVIS